MAIKIGDKEIASMLVGTGAGNKEIKEVWQGTNNGNKLVWQSLIIPEGYALATDDDFIGTTDGNFQYIGTDEYVVIPNVIKGVPVTSYAGMFMGNSVIKGVASNNTNVTNMNSMFGSSSATTLDLGSFDTSNVTDMSDMFYNSSATALDLSSFDTSNVTSMSYMFGESSATALDLSNFDTYNVTDMSYMFDGSQATTLDLSNFDTSNVTSMTNMFYNSRATTLDLSSFDTSNVTYMGSMFRNSSATTGYARTQADADRFNTSGNKPTNLNFILPPPPLATDDDFSGTVDGEFRYIGTATRLTIPHVIKGVEVTSYASMFSGTTVTEVSSNNPRITDMSSMFRDNSATTLDLSSFDTSSVTFITNMFYLASATIGYARTQVDKDKLNNSSNKPAGLTFIVKP